MDGPELGLIAARREQRRAPRALDHRLFAIECFGQDLGGAGARCAEFTELFPAAIAISRQTCKIDGQNWQY